MGAVPCPRHRQLVHRRDRQKEPQPCVDPFDGPLRLYTIRFLYGFVASDVGALPDNPHLLWRRRPVLEKVLLIDLSLRRNVDHKSLSAASPCGAFLIADVLFGSFHNKRGFFRYLFGDIMCL